MRMGKKTCSKRQLAIRMSRPEPQTRTQPGALGVEVTAAGAAACYRGLLGAWVVDEADRGLVPRIEATGVRVGVTDTIMTDDGAAESLARFALELVG